MEIKITSHKACFHYNGVKNRPGVSRIGKKDRFKRTFTPLKLYKVYMTFYRLRPLILPSFLSLVLHLMLFSFITELISQYSNEIQQDKPADKAIKVTTMTSEEIKKYRTVGVKNGAKDFNAPVKKPKPASAANPKSEAIKLGQLGGVDTSKVPMPAPKPTYKPNESQDASPLQLVSDSNASVQVKTVRTQDRYNRLKNMGVAESDAQKLSKTDFDVNFIPPEGVSEDELNSAEKIFYSFQKRTFETYVSSFLSTYNDLVRSNPRLRDPLLQQKHFLTARVIFDEQGNIMTIRILKSSPNDDIHQLFERTLRNIRKVPNPPKDLLTKEKTMTIYYQLKVN